MNSRYKTPEQIEFADLMESLNWKAVDVARELGLSKSAVSLLLAGKRNIRPQTLELFRRVAAETLAASKAGEPNIRLEKVTASLTQSVPVVSWATAGAGGNFCDLAEQIGEHLESDTKDANAYALIIEGDSMLPEFKTGDRVIFEPNRQAANGDVVVARVEKTGDVFFKLFHTFGAKGDMVRLNSFNPAFPPIEIPLKSFRFIHPMHSMVRRYKR